MSVEVSHYKKKKSKPEKDLVIKTDKVSLPSSSFRFAAIAGIAVLIAVMFLISWVNFAKRPAGDSNSQFQYFEIRKGESTLTIGRELENLGIIRSKFAFYLVSKLDGKKLQAGHYKISASQPMDEILEKFENGKLDAYSVTIPEGYRVLQIAKVLQEKGGVDPDKFIEAAIGTEGTLFPDTYVFPFDLPPAKIVRQMRENYDKKTESLRVTPEQLILASIVEREAKTDDERPKIAAVYKNRADQNMLLQADPTVRYALDTQTYLKNKSLDFDFWRAITRFDYQNLNSPFNTYKQKGYPPAPICNPGLKSILAAVNPENNFDYLYFFHDKNLQIHFSKTLDEHQKLIKEFGLPGQN